MLQEPSEGALRRYRTIGVVLVCSEGCWGLLRLVVGDGLHTCR